MATLRFMRIYLSLAIRFQDKLGLVVVIEGPGMG